MNANREPSPPSTVSIGLPVFNGERYLESTVQSILSISPWWCDWRWWRTCSSSIASTADVPCIKPIRRSIGRHKLAFLNWQRRTPIANA